MQDATAMLFVYNHKFVRLLKPEGLVITISGRRKLIKNCFVKFELSL